MLHLRGTELMLQRPADERCDLRRGYAQSGDIPCLLYTSDAADDSIRVVLEVVAV